MRRHPLVERQRQRCQADPGEHAADQVEQTVADQQQRQRAELDELPLLAVGMQHQQVGRRVEHQAGEPVRRHQLQVLGETLADLADVVVPLDAQAHGEGQAGDQRQHRDERIGLGGGGHLSGRRLHRGGGGGEGVVGHVRRPCLKRSMGQWDSNTCRRAARSAQ